MTSVIIGAKRLDQLNNNLNSVNIKLSDEELKKLNDVSKLAPEYPGGMLKIQSSNHRPGQTRSWDLE